MTALTLETLVSGEHRHKRNIARNDARHPVETLEFFGLTPDMTVLEILPAVGWYTEILAPYLSEHGRLYVAHFSPDAPCHIWRRCSKCSDQPGTRLSNLDYAPLAELNQARETTWST